MRNPEIRLDTSVYPETTKCYAKTSNLMSSAMADSFTQPFYIGPEAADYLVGREELVLSACGLNFFSFGLIDCDQ